MYVHDVDDGCDDDDGDDEKIPTSIIVRMSVCLLNEQSVHMARASSSSSDNGRKRY